MNLLALGSCIGVGLFLGSAKAIELAGPAILVGYLAGGLVLLVIMRALAELTLASANPASFVGHAREHISPYVAYLTGWLYWAMWIVTCVAELSAIAVYMHAWFPDVPGWIWSLVALICIGGVNLATTRLFGEFEYWFALIKVVVIVALIVAGLAMICLGLGAGGTPVGFANLWQHGGFAPHGVKGVMLAMQMVMFAYLGVEMLGLAVTGVKQPDRVIPRVFGAVFWRILVFYFGALFVILCLYPWNEIGTNGSPFVRTFERLGIGAAGDIINFVVITAALSSCSGGIFSTGRMLYGMATEHKAPRRFMVRSPSGVPRAALAVSISTLVVGVALNFLAPERIFSWATAVATFAAIWTWCVILVAHLRYRSKRPKGNTAAARYGLRFSPYSNYGALIFLGGLIIIMALSPDTRPALLLGPIFIAVLTFAYRFVPSDRV
ncbi:amino acid permease [Sphingomonas arantia]|uniref:Amino acid permease n=1 Tax=Sphingomonas arantia TaxID=1460676 RepID=A0ABW4U1M1_9SPHN